MITCFWFLTDKTVHKAKKKDIVIFLKVVKLIIKMYG